MAARTFATEAYRLTFAEDRPFVYLETPAGERLAALFTLSSIHTLAAGDDTPQAGDWELSALPGETVFSLRTGSSCWQSKTYRFRCYPHSIRYEVEVEGYGQLAEADYFGGYCSAYRRWGSGFFWSGQHFHRGFNPEPTSAEVYHFTPDGNSVIDLQGVPLPGKSGWFFTPPPFCFALELPSGWLALGVEAAAGQNRFADFRYHGQPAAFYLSLAYEGHTAVDGRYLLPAIRFHFAPDEYAGLAAYVRQAHPGLFVAGREGADSRPRWWRTPIFCGWGAQCHLAARHGGCGPDYARQEHYEAFIQTLEANGLHPGIVVLDDKWQASYGENRVDEQKWPDLPGFIARQHAAGRKVLLWLKAWDAEGLPASECIINAAELPVAFDPTRPAFARRLRTAIRRMLSPSGYNADGFKVDFTARIPSGPGLRCHGDSWGLELMKAYLEILYTEAKRVKPEALVMTHTPHPYLAEVVDMIRLNDINTGSPVNPAMTHRAKIAALACPSALIDTDNWPMPDKAAWREYLQLQPHLGVPSLYYATHIDATGEALEAEDYRLIRETWERCKP